MNAVSQWWIGGLRTRKAKVMSSILMGGSTSIKLGISFSWLKGSEGIPRNR